MASVWDISKPTEDLMEQASKTVTLRVYERVKPLYRVSIMSFPDYKHLLQENYVEYKYIFFYHYLS